jgi:hypothetical protein
MKSLLSYQQFLYFLNFKMTTILSYLVKLNKNNKYYYNLKICNLFNFRKYKTENEIINNTNK